MKAILAVLGGTGKTVKDFMRDYLDNLLSAWVDEWISRKAGEYAKEYADELAKVSRDTKGTTPKPDLTVLPVTFSPSSAKRGDRISVSFTVKNQGGAASGPFSTRVSLASSRWGTDTSLGNFSMGGLAAGASQSSTVSVTIPDATAGTAIAQLTCAGKTGWQEGPTSGSPGSFWVTVFADGLQAVPEEDENNNIGSSDPNKISIPSGVRYNCDDPRNKTSAFDFR